MPHFPEKLEIASQRNDCPETWDELGTFSNRSYLYLLDNQGDYIRNWQGLPIIVGLPPSFSEKLDETSLRDTCIEEDDPGGGGGGGR